MDYKVPETTAGDGSFIYYPEANAVKENGGYTRIWHCGLDFIVRNDHKGILTCPYCGKTIR